MAQDTSSIFIKHKDIPREPICLDTNDILKTIPGEYLSEPDPTKSHKTEYRWRFLEIDNKEFVEISIKKPNSTERKYADKYGNWSTKHCVSPKFDMYVTKQFFYYV